MTKHDKLLVSEASAASIGGDCARPSPVAEVSGPMARTTPMIVSPCAAFLRPRAVTAHYGIHRSSLYRALAEGKITAVKAGRAVLIDGDSLRAYLASLPRAEFKAP